MKVAEAVLNFFFPPKCPFCAKVLDRVGICDACRQTLPRIETQDAVRAGPGGLHCAAPLWYEGAVRDGILRFKFQGGTAAAKPFGELVASCAAEHFSGEFDIVTWVPVSKKRKKKRGYDQAELLARSACKAWGVRPVPLLRKTADTPAQSGLKESAARRANVLGVYEAVPDVEIAGKRALLIDDICTTGSTLTECIRVLKDAGAESVVCAVLAMTRERRENVIK